MQTFTLRPKDEFIELNKLLKLEQLVQSGGHAKVVIDDGLVTVNGEVEMRKRKKLFAGDIIEFDGHQIKIAK